MCRSLPLNFDFPHARAEADGPAAISLYTPQLGLIVHQDMFTSVRRGWRNERGYACYVGAIGVQAMKQVLVVQQIIVALRARTMSIGEEAKLSESRAAATSPSRRS